MTYSTSLLMYLKNLPIVLFLYLYMFVFSTSDMSAQSRFVQYPSYAKRIISPGNTQYFIDPVKGNDKNNGFYKNKAWKTFHPVNRLILSQGDVLEIISPGSFYESLVLIARGTRDKPIKIRFTAGIYYLYPNHTLKQKLFISNTNDTPYEPKAIALMFDSCSFINVSGINAKFILRGKMIETYLKKSNDIQLSNLTFDYYRPTVSEFTVTATGPNYVDLQVHKDSKFMIKDGLLTWIGEGWSHQSNSYWQKFNIENKEVSRTTIDIQNIRFASLSENKIRAYSRSKAFFKNGYTYQTRDVKRDCVGTFIENCKNVILKDMKILFMHGMGIVAQYSENIKIDNIQVKPADTSGRTCSAWADILHFSGCKGLIDIGNSYLSGANDDAINIHGTHLNIKQINSSKQLVVEFVNKQSFGFEPFAVGDSLDFIRPETLIPIGSNKVTQTKKLNDKEFLISLNDPIPATVKLNHVIENTTATPSVWIHNNTITMIPTRGVLTTTRRKIIIENNNFLRIHMSGVLISDDAKFWYESGVVRDMTITGNLFRDCGEPVVDIHPENTEKSAIPVHRNIKIIDNRFYLRKDNILAARSTSNITLYNNKIWMFSPLKNINELIILKDSPPATLSGNKVNLQ